MEVHEYLLAFFRDELLDCDLCLDLTPGDVSVPRLNQIGQHASVASRSRECSSELGTGDFLATATQERLRLFRGKWQKREWRDSGTLDDTGHPMRAGR